jgi:hypothetical protein
VVFSYAATPQVMMGGCVEDMHAAFVYRITRHIPTRGKQDIGGPMCTVFLSQDFLLHPYMHFSLLCPVGQQQLGVSSAAHCASSASAGTTVTPLIVRRPY